VRDSSFVLKAVIEAESVDISALESELSEECFCSITVDVSIFDFLWDFVETYWYYEEFFFSVKEKCFVVIESRTVSSTITDYNLCDFFWVLKITYIKQSDFKAKDRSIVDSSWCVNFICINCRINFFSNADDMSNSPRIFGL